MRGKSFSGRQEFVSLTGLCRCLFSEKNKTKHRLCVAGMFLAVQHLCWCEFEPTWVELQCVATTWFNLSGIAQLTFSPKEYRLLKLFAKIWAITVSTPFLHCKTFLKKIHSNLFWEKFTLIKVFEFCLYEVFSEEHNSHDGCFRLFVHMHVSQYILLFFIAK